jgi:light-regulated signal transduction histidine kinase (bacteriophytochrome)
MDINDRKLAQLELARLNAELEHRVHERTSRLEVLSRELEAFAFNIAHDLKAPLRAISGFSRLLREDYDAVLDDEGRRRLDIVTSNAEKLDALISDIVTVTRIGVTEPRITRIAMREMAFAMYCEVASAEDASCIAFKLGDLPDCEGDTTMMRKAWGNLLSNAIKFTAGKYDRTIEVFADVSELEIRYSIRDNGVGFDTQRAGKLFKLFGRLHRDDEYAGTGAGLAIVKRIVELQGGCVGAESSTGTGTVFWFSLPRKGTSKFAKRNCIHQAVKWPRYDWGEREQDVTNQDTLCGRFAIGCRTRGEGTS